MQTIEREVRRGRQAGSDRQQKWQVVKLNLVAGKRYRCPKPKPNLVPVPGMVAGGGNKGPRKPREGKAKA